MHHSGGVDRDQGVGQADGESLDQSIVEPAAGGDRVRQVPALDVLRGHPRPLPGQVGVEHGGDGAAPDSAGRVDLVPETGPELGIVGESGRRHLHGRRLAVGVETEVNDAHPTRADAVRQPVRADAPGVVRGQGRQHAACLLSVVGCRGGPAVPAHLATVRGGDAPIVSRAVPCTYLTASSSLCVKDPPPGNRNEITCAFRTLHGPVTCDDALDHVFVTSLRPPDVCGVVDAPPLRPDGLREKIWPMLGIERKN